MENNKTLLYILGFVAVLFILYLLFDSDKPECKQSKDNHQQHGNNKGQAHPLVVKDQPHSLYLSTPEPKQKKYFVLFYAPWCGGCKQMKPIWHNAKQKLNGMNDVEMVEIDLDERKDLVNKHNIHSIPTMKMMYDDVENPSKIVDYNGQRDENALKEFMSACH